VRQIILLRGVNLGPRNRVAMPALRQLLSDAGFAGVRTYMHSGNAVLSSDLAARALAQRCRELIAERFGLDIVVLARTRDELARVIARDPLGDVAADHKRYQVSFLESKLDKRTLQELSALAAPSERFVAIGRELYAWHPRGVARSKLWARLASARLGVAATARNWTTVTALLALADEERSG
jgi:uncharacterized protein (DUF1697 family)